VSGPEPEARVAVVAGQEPWQNLGLDLHRGLGLAIQEAHDLWITIHGQQIIDVTLGELPQDQPVGDLDGCHTNERGPAPTGPQPDFPTTRQ
jgi:hypothetical protein